MGVLLTFKISKLCIMPFGAYISFKINIKNYNTKILNGTICSLKKLFVALAGPIANIIIALIFYNKSDYIIITYINILLAVFNLLPIYPLDGGRLVREILHITVGLKKAETYTYKISKFTLILLTIIASIAILYLQNISIIIILAYLLGIVLVERKRYYTRRSIHRILAERINESALF